jgi:hypothetical protein
VLSLESTLRCRPAVESRETPDGAVLVDMASGNCFELNHVGRLLWLELAPTRTLGQVCEALLPRFDVPREVIERDALALLEDLRRVGLVEIVSPSLASAVR